MASASLQEITRILTLLSTAPQEQHAMYFELLARMFSELAITGWGAPTGVATRATFATGAVTLPVLAEHVKALIDDLTSQGMIGP